MPSLVTPLPRSGTAIGVLKFDAAGPKADEATWVTIAASDFDYPPPLASWPDGDKLTKDKLDGAKDKKPWPPLLVAQGCFELFLINGNEAKHFHMIPSSFVARAAWPLLLDQAPSSNLLDLVMTCLRTSDSMSESLSEFLPPSDLHPAAEPHAFATLPS